MKILHLEDNAQDAELTHASFRDEWPDCEIDVVDTREDFLEQLKERHDLILSDFNMPKFNGLEALQLARVQAPEVPFIFFSGTIGEERAIDALKSGANDYVIKDRPQRLLPVMRRALMDAKLARERKLAEEHLLRVQRLENVGMLTAGIAHDFNNILAPIMMGLSILRARHLEPSDQKLYVTMENSAKRGAGLVKQIMSFSQGVSGTPQRMDVRPLIREVVTMAQQTFPTDIAITTDFTLNVPPVKVNPTQFHQVILNLCVNARDAMPNGGTLKIHVANRHVKIAAAAGLEISSGDYVAIEVSDTGTGIPPEIMARIWEPFFTTKEPGRGTGLGLSTVRGIVENHGGAISVQTTAGRGTSFEVLFPVAPPETEAPAPEPSDRG